MSNLTSFPAAKLAAAKLALAALHTKLSRAAARTGQVAPEAPTIEVTAAYTTLECTTCDATPGAWTRTRNTRCAVCPEGGYILPVERLDLTLVAPRPALAGWEFLAVVEPLDGGNMLRKVPGSAEVDLTSYRSVAPVCNHCKTSRRRAETFLVMADGTDPAVAAGTIYQVGRSCLKDFLGGLTPSAVLMALTYEAAIKEASDESSGGGGGRPELTYDPTEFLAWTVSVVRSLGWTPRSAASDTRHPTADTVAYLLAPPWGNAEVRAAWEAARKEHAPTDADTARAAEVLAWARALETSNDYLWNLALAARQEMTGHRQFGVLASAVTAYERHLGTERKRTATAAAAPSTHQGEGGKRLDLTLTVERVNTVETQYGNLHINVLKDTAGNVYVWKTGSVRLTPGETVTGKGTIKAHGEFAGVAQTELSRCKF